MKYAQQTGSFKSRRMEAFKELASLSRTSKEMKDFKLTKRTREIALENFSKTIDQYDSDKRSWPIDMDKVILNMRPGNMPSYTDAKWNIINAENLLFLYGKLIPSNRKALWLSVRSNDIHDELINYFPSVSTLTPLEAAEPTHEDEYEQEEGFNRVR